MKQFNFNQTIDSPVENKELFAGRTMGEILCDQLMLVVSQNKDEITKYMTWAFTLGKKEHLFLDEADVKKLKDFIADNQAMVAIVKYNMFKELDNGKPMKKS